MLATRAELTDQVLLGIASKTRPLIPVSISMVLRPDQDKVRPHLITS